MEDGFSFYKQPTACHGDHGKRPLPLTSASKIFQEIFGGSHLLFASGDAGASLFTSVEMFHANQSHGIFFLLE
jgi:hypothetical protein